MYRIRRLTGGEVNLASLDELAAAISAGTVTADAEIYHQRADRWLPIANHPHFRIAKDRSQSPVRKPTPVPAAPSAGQPALRLVRSDMKLAPEVPESRPVSRWTPPVRSMPPARPQGSAVPAPAPEPVTEVVEFVAEKPAEPPAPAPVEPLRPKRVEPATAGLPLLDIEPTAPPRTMREPTPMPSPSMPRVPLGLPEPGPTPIGMRQPTPMPSPSAWASMHGTPRTAPKLEPTPAPAPVRMPTPVQVAVAPAPEPAPVIEAPRPRPAPWSPPVVEASLDVPPAVVDFSEPAPEAVASEAGEPVLAAAVPVEAGRSASRWPMIAGALIVAAIVGFLALRPRSEVESLDPRTPAVAATPAQPSTSTPASNVASSGSTRPQITPVVPPGPSPELPAAAPVEETRGEVMPAAPRLVDKVPESAFKDVGAISVDVDPTATQRQKALEATRRQIETEMQR
jgi:hypothetical protein